MRRMVVTTALAALMGTAAPALAQTDGQTNGWWHGFHDPLIDAAVGAALDGNLDLAAAAARVEQARALDHSARAALLPSVDAGGSAEADSVSRATPFGEAARKLGFARNYQLYQAGVEAHWEIDLFGGLSARHRVATAQAGATLAEAQAVRLAVVAETADACLRLRGVQVRLVLAQDQARDRAELAALARQRAEAGLSSDAEARHAEAERAAAEAAVPPLRAALAVALDRLSVLTGGGGGWRALVDHPDAIPAALAPALDTDPATLMRRRPDLVAAEHRVVAAQAGIAVARAEYYPHVSLGGLLGVASLGTASITSDDATTAQASAAIRWRLFDFGRVDAEVAASRGREREALAQWREAALVASAEVADAVAALDAGTREAAALADEVAQLTRTRAQAQAAFSEGLAGRSEVLLADQALAAASDRLARAREALARASVAAVRAMGGGFTRELATNHG